MTTLREAAQQALDFIRWSQFVPCQSEPFPEPPSTAPQVEAALKVALAEPVQEPVAWRYQDARGNYRYRGYVQGFDKEYSLLKPVPLYAAPPQRPAEPSQEPVAWVYTGIKQDGTEHGPHLVWKPAYMDAMSASKGAQATPLYTAPPQPKERNFCPRCGKQTQDIHTCTPPK